jgi:S-formylglutathione hydrolase FrmB
VRLLTPRGWRSRDPARRWPVLYLLHGCCDSYDSWTRETGIEGSARLRDVLVVMPEGGSVGFYSNWLGGDGADAPGWETFHLHELRALLERDFGAGERRAVAGLSMGGLGAMLYAARRPHLFRAAAAFSGVLHPLRSPDAYLGLFSQYTADPRVVWGDPRDDRAVWARHDPTEEAAGLRGVRLFVSAGDGRPGPLDPPGTARDGIEAGLLPEAVALVTRLARLGIPVRARLYGRGTHSWPYWERELRRALPLLLAATDGRESGA